MKRFISLFMIVMFLVIFAANYFSYQTESYQTLLSASDTYTFEFKVPEDIINADPKNIDSLKAAAKKNKVNIIRTFSYHDNAKNESYTEEYLWLTTDTRLFQQMRITDGEVLTHDDMPDTEKFMSTNHTNNVNQVGVIANFGGRGNYSISIIDHITSNYRYSGSYQVEADSVEQYNLFVQDYVNYINESSGEEFTPDMYQDNIDEERIISQEVFDILIFILFFLVIMFLTFLYDLISQTKAISVMKLNGHPRIFISYQVFIKFFSINFLVSQILIVPFLFFIKDNSFAFVYKVYLTNFLLYFSLLCVLTFISYVYTSMIKTTYCINGKKPIGVITFLNSIFKLIVSTIIIVIVVSIISDLTLIQQKQAALNNWAETADLGVFHPVKSGEDAALIRAGEYPLDIPSYFMYPELNQKFEAIYINSDLYTTDSLEVNLGNDYIKSITVNPNYLINYPLYDSEGQQIEINESMEETVFLVPEQYRDKEEQNKDYFGSARERFHRLHQELYQQNNKHKSKEVTFIYTKTGQEVFSLNTNVMPNHYNIIVDPIIQVITESNALVPDTFYTSTSNQTLFIRLIETDTEKTYEKLLPILQEYSLDDNFPYLIRINDLILSEINTLKEEIYVTITILLSLILLLVITLIQYIYLIFQRHRYEFFVKKTFGQSFLNKYHKILLVSIFINIIEFIICLSIIETAFYHIFLIKIVIEFAIIITMINYFEKQNTVNMLKEGA
ncbi:bacteriocin-associated integral membrane protein [Natronobacillus azotifigens]|uniref:DUF1430 domain-containing protein n=1 Tax=Natronobacillus azotifigens TaxID=472978 RepID=A0A9J6RGL6_9BACI|nr:hypothetical protein [Natronobacillus azotifigens]